MRTARCSGALLAALLRCATRRRAAPVRSSAARCSGVPPTGALLQWPNIATGFPFSPTITLGWRRRKTKGKKICTRQKDKQWKICHSLQIATRNTASSNRLKVLTDQLGRAVVGTAIDKDLSAGMLKDLRSGARELSSTAAIDR